jgi:hypothetical protein
LRRATRAGQNASATRTTTQTDQSSPDIANLHVSDTWCGRLPDIPPGRGVASRCAVPLRGFRGELSPHIAVVAPPKPSFAAAHLRGRFPEPFLRHSYDRICAEQKLPTSPFRGDPGDPAGSAAEGIACATLLADAVVIARGRPLLRTMAAARRMAQD